MGEALLIENPRLSSPKTIDCVSCHVASRALRAASTAAGTTWPDRPEHFVPSSPFELTRVDDVGDDPKALRALGYLGARSAFSQRTMNESAEVAARLSAAQ